MSSNDDLAVSDDLIAEDSIVVTNYKMNMHMRRMNLVTY